MNSTARYFTVNTLRLDYKILPLKAVQATLQQYALHRDRQYWTLRLRPSAVHITVLETDRIQQSQCPRCEL